MIEPILERMPLRPDQRQFAGQVIRFGISGVFLTVLVLALSWGFEHWFAADPNLAFAIAFVIASGVGFVLHGQWSFKGHGGRDRAHVRLAQFFVSNIIGFALNQMFVWLVRKHFGLPFWVEAIPIMVVTPLVSFFLNRKWVFA